jgi:hypothetical protein
VELKVDLDRSTAPIIQQVKSPFIKNEVHTNFSSLKEYEEKKIAISKIYIDEENTNDKLRRRSHGLCQYCGGPFKKKYLFFGDSICAKCGKKDY